MQIKILDSWLREYLETNASSNDIERELSLRSVSVERVEKLGNDFVYDIEVTTNRVDLMGVVGIANEACAALSEAGIAAKFNPPKIPEVKEGDISFPIEIKNDPSLVNRIMAQVLEIEIGQSPKYIKERLEATGVRSLNNIVDVTNYVMREIGHPAHVFDFDLLSRKMIIRRSNKGEEITTLDGKKYSLYGGDIIADNGEGEIIDLLGVMGTANSVVNDKTKRILFFLDNNNPQNIRKTSMSLGIRTEAAIINEKGVDPNLLETAFKRGIELYTEIAKAKSLSKVLDIYPNKVRAKSLRIESEKINKVIGVTIDPSKSKEILQKLGFSVSIKSATLLVEIPTQRLNDIKIEEDIIEEIARIYGYHRLPSVIPAFLTNESESYANNFFFEEKVKNALKYMGFTEVYTYSMVSEDLYEGPVEKGVKLTNPLTEDMVYLRNSLIPSLLKVTQENKTRDTLRIFEMSNIYLRRENDLPKEILTLSGIFKRQNASFFEVKGVLEILLKDLGIGTYKFRKRLEGPGAELVIENKNIGYIEILNQNLIDFELNLSEILIHANNKKKYVPIAKFPAIIEDLTFILGDDVLTDEVVNEIALQSFLIKEVRLKDQFENARTFRVEYRADDKNLTTKDISKIREEVIESISQKFNASIK